MPADLLLVDRRLLGEHDLVHCLLLVGLQRGAAGDDPGRLRDPRDESSPAARWTGVAGLGL